MTRAGVVIGVIAIAASAHAQTFSRVEFYPEMRLDYVLAVADFNDDGRDDVLAGGREESVLDGSPEDRHDVTAVEVFFGQEDGTFEHAPRLIDGKIQAWQPIVVAADFNNDEQVDFAVFDAGVYVGEESVGYGNPPQLWLSDDGVLRSSDNLADAVRAEHALRPPAGKGLSAPADLHVKSAAAGDIDSDGDLDLWVESTGGKNVVSHFMVNNGSGEFRIERDRATDAVFRNNPPDYWRHVGNSFVDVDNDGDPDLALGQIQDDGLAWRPYSIVAVNDGTGHYPSRIELPDPAFNDGHTAAQALAHFDVNRDGFEDLLLVHERDGPPEVLSFTGRYIQVLINDDGEAFVDETSTWMGDQSLTTPERYPNGDPLHNAARPRMLDINRDGCEDIVMANANTLIRSESPIFYLNEGSGRFRPVDPDEMFTGMNWSGIYSVPADVNGDGVIDLVFPQRVLGPDDEYGTEDDSTRFLTLLNTTPGGPVRCRARVTVVGTLPARTLHVGDGAVAEVVPVGGGFRHTSTYRASSSAPGVATVSMSGSNLTVTPVAAGVAIITVTATGADNSVATQRFKVTVLAAPAATTFSDRLVPGATPIRAIHFLELRTRVAALRSRQGLPAVRWTDPILTVGVTPVKRVHLSELRDALGETYDAAGQSRPTYTDPIVTMGMTAIKAVHVVELRNAIVALE